MTVPDVEALAVDARTLARLLHVSLRTVRAMDSAGKLPRPVRLAGRSIRWPVNEIRNWLDQGAPDRCDWEALRRSGKSGQ